MTAFNPYRNYEISNISILELRKLSIKVKNSLCSNSRIGPCLPPKLGLASLRYTSLSLYPFRVVP